MAITISSTAAETPVTPVQPAGDKSPPYSPSPDPSSPSLYDIAHRHPRERLLVKPHLWTDRHLELLRCSFSEPPETAEASSVEYTLTTGPVNKRYMDKCVNDLGTAWSHPKMAHAIKRIIASKECPLRDYSNYSEPRFPLYFYFSWGQPIKLDCLPLYLEHGPYLRLSYPPAPVVAYVSDRLMDRERWHALRPPSVVNPEYWRQCERDHRKITPSDSRRDPYILAVLVAQAQAKRNAAEYGQQARGSDEFGGIRAPEDAAAPGPALTPCEIPASSPSHVLATFEDDPDYIHHYTANIPTAFLDMFQYPSSHPQAPASVHIRHTRLPIQPQKSLRERLLQRILPLATEQSRKQKREEDGPPHEEGFR